MYYKPTEEALGVASQIYLRLDESIARAKERNLRRKLRRKQRPQLYLTRGGKAVRAFYAQFDGKVELWWPTRW